MSREHDHHEHEMLIIKEKLHVSEENLHVIRIEVERSEREGHEWKLKYEHLHIEYEQLKHE
jgi:hypothetical protein